MLAPVPMAPDARDAGLAPGDRIVAVDGASPLTLMARVRALRPEHHAEALAFQRRNGAAAPALGMSAIVRVDPGS